MQLYWNKRKRLREKRVNCHRTGLGHKIVAVSLFWDTNMAAETSCERLYVIKGRWSRLKLFLSQQCSTSAGRKSHNTGEQLEVIISP